MSRMRTLTFFMVLLLALPLMAADVSSDDSQNKPLLTVSDAIAETRKNNVSLQIAQVQLNTAIREANAVSSTYMPTINLTGSIGTTTGGWGFINSNLQSGLTYSVGLDASMTFAGNMITDGTRRNLERISANLTYESNWETLEKSVVDSYWNLVACDNSVQVAMQTLESSQNTLLSTKESYEAGLVDELAYVQAQYQVSRDSLNVKNLQDTKQLALDAFEILTGIEDASIYELEDLPETIYLQFPSPVEVYAKYGNNSLSIRQSQNNLQVAENTSDTLKWSSWAPSLSVSASYGINQTPILPNPHSPESTTDLSDGLSLTATLTVPISAYIPGSSTFLDIQASEDSITEYRLRLKDAQDTLINDINTDTQTIIQNQESIDLLEENLQQAQYAYDLSEEAYNAGLITITDLNSSRINLFTTQLNMISTQLEHLSSCYDLAYLLGVDLSTLQEVYRAVEPAPNTETN